MAVLLPIAGGKGGVGKSILSLNLAITLANQCKRTILCDLDLGGANLHTMLGLKNNQAGLGTFISKLETDFTNLLQATGIQGLNFIAGDCLFPGVANMDFFTKKKIMQNINNLDADYVILDLGVGSTHNIVDFFLSSYNGVLVVTPEITSIMNAYSFLKSVVFRFLYRQFSTKSAERKILQNSILQRLEGKEYSFSKILDVMQTKFPESVAKAKDEMKKLRPRVIMNMGRDFSNIEMGNRLQHLVKNKLSIEIEYIGYVPYDENIPFSVARRQPITIMAPNSQFCSVLNSIVHRIIETNSPSEIFLQDATESFEDIVKSFYDKQHLQDTE